MPHILCGMNPPNAPRTLVAALVTGVAAILVASCSSGSGGPEAVAETAVELIEGELAEQIDLGELEGECEEPADAAEGETFTCSATTEDGRTIEFLGTLESEDEVNVVSTNVLVERDIDAVREEGARALSEETGQAIEPDDIECDDVIILEGTDDFECAITEPETGEVYGLTVSTGGIDPGVGVRDLSFEISQEPL